MTNIPNDSYSHLLNCSTTRDICDVSDFSGLDYTFEEAWSLAESNALSLTELLHYDYDDIKALQFLLLLGKIIFRSNNVTKKAKSLFEEMGVKFEKDALREIANMILSYDCYDELDLRKPSELAVFMLRIVREMGFTFGFGDFTSFENISNKLNNYTDELSVFLLEGGSPIVKAKEIIKERFDAIEILAREEQQ